MHGDVHKSPPVDFSRVLRPKSVSHLDRRVNDRSKLLHIRSRRPSVCLWRGARVHQRAFSVCALYENLTHVCTCTRHGTHVRNRYERSALPRDTVGHRDTASQSSALRFPTQSQKLWITSSKVTECILGLAAREDRPRQRLDFSIGNAFIHMPMHLPHLFERVIVRGQCSVSVVLRQN